MGLKHISLRAAARLKTFGVIQINRVGIVDESCRGDGDRRLFRDFISFTCKGAVFMLKSIVRLADLHRTGIIYSPGGEMPPQRSYTSL
jgi:hypothetical protein